MVWLTLFGAVLLGLLFPRFVRNSKAFGISVVLVLVLLLSELSHIRTSTTLL